MRPDERDHWIRLSAAKATYHSAPRRASRTSDPASPHGVLRQHTISISGQKATTVPGYARCYACYIDVVIYRTRVLYAQSMWGDHRFALSGTAWTSVRALIFAVIDMLGIQVCLNDPGVEFVFTAGTSFMAKFVLPHEQNRAGARFQTMTQVR